MAKEFYGFFDSTEGDVRLYDAAEFSHLLSAVVQDGVTSHNGGGLQVTANGESMQTTVSEGGAVISGYVFVLSDDGGDARTFTHQVSGAADRIDRVVVRLDLNSRTMELALLEGVPAAQPKPPSLTRTSQVREISLAQVRIRASALFVEAEDVTDERADESVCGYAVPVWNNRETLDSSYAANQPITDEQISSLIV